MGRKKIDIDLLAMQEILDKEKTSFAGKLYDYYEHCCGLYNKEFRPKKPISSSNVYTRIAKTKELRFDPPEEFTKTPKVFTEEHKNKLRESRKTRNRRSRKNMNEAHDTALRTEYSGKEKLVDRVLSGSLRAAIQAKCINCCGGCIDNNPGVVETIRTCTSLDCALWNFRPYQLKIEVDPTDEV